MYPEQIRKLQLLVEELETLKDAKQIIENYKKEYQQYIVDVPEFVMKMTRMVSTQGWDSQTLTKVF